MVHNPQIAYHRLVPRDSFVGRYLQYMANQETAYDYDWWCALWCLSAACARNSFVDRPRAPVYLNMFTILVGDSGVARKTTSVSIASRIARSLLVPGSPLGYLDAKVTPEQLDLLLHNRTIEHGSAQLCVAVPELAVFMGTEQYIAHMPTLLTDLYDCPSARDGGGTIRRGAVTQRNVWLHFLSASTPTWLLKTVNPNVVEGGFTSRCYFIVSHTPKRRIPWPQEGDPQLFADMCDDIRIVAAEARAKGPLTLTPKAIDTFTRWYASRVHSTDPFKQSFEAREDAHVLRLAALLAINDGSWLVARSHIGVAVRLCASIKRTSGAIFETAEARTKYAVALDILRSQLVSSGMDPIPRHRLYLKCRNHVDRMEFYSLLEVLDEIGAIQRFELQERRGPPTDFIRGTRLLMSPKLGEAVMERFT